MCVHYATYHYTCHVSMCQLQIFLYLDPGARNVGPNFFPFSLINCFTGPIHFFHFMIQ